MCRKDTNICWRNKTGLQRQVSYKELRALEILC
jgi:hypothetical protein